MLRGSARRALRRATGRAHQPLHATDMLPMRVLTHTLSLLSILLALLQRVAMSGAPSKTERSSVSPGNPNPKTSKTLNLVSNTCACNRWCVVRGGGATQRLACRRMQQQRGAGLFFSRRPRRADRSADGASLCTPCSDGDLKHALMPTCFSLDAGRSVCAALDPAVRVQRR